MSFEQTLTEAAQSVLEIMFFSETEPCPPAPTSGGFRIQVCFEGHRRGDLAVELPAKCARAMAASFEGVADAESLPEETAHQVAAELSNMICGATLARLNPDGLFTLRAPSVSKVQTAAAAAPTASECWLQIPSMDDGVMHLVLTLEGGA